MCIDHDRPFVADIVWRKDCKVVKPACETCIAHLQDLQQVRDPIALKKAVQYRLP